MIFGTIWVRYQQAQKKTNVTIQLRRWYLLCLRLDAGRLSLHLDDNINVLDLKESVLFPPLVMNGTLVIGNDQDTLGGGFAPVHSYFGAVSGFTIWAQGLTVQQMLDLFECKEPVGYLLGWDQTPWQLDGDVDITEGNPCHEAHKRHYLIFPVKKSMVDARRFCHGLGMRIPSPLTLDEYHTINSLMNQSIDECIPYWSSKLFMWVDIQYNEERGQYVDMQTQKPVEYSVKVLNEMVFENQIAFGSNGTWYKMPDRLNLCFMCVGKIQTKAFYLLNLCQEDNRRTLSSTFYPRGDPYNIISLYSNSGRKITRNSKNVWNLYIPSLQDPIASFKGQEAPIGRHQWLTLQENSLVCDDNHISVRNMTAANNLTAVRSLTLSSCQPGYFTCWDGSCIPLDQRCSLVTECPDHSYSDELNCTLARVPAGYQKLISPASPTLDLSLALVLNTVR